MTAPLHTARTTLTLLTEADLPAMEALAREPDTFKYIKKLRVMNPEQYTRFLHTKLEQIHTGVGYHWAVWLKDNLADPVKVSSDSSVIGPKNNPTDPAKVSAPFKASPEVPGSPSHFIGAVNLNPIKGISASPNGPVRLQIGCQLKRDYWGQGFASELTARILHFAIHELRLPAVYGVFEQGNAISRRLLEKLGFVFEESFQEQEIITEIHKYVRKTDSGENIVRFPE